MYTLGNQSIHSFIHSFIHIISFNIVFNNNNKGCDFLTYSLLKTIDGRREVDVVK